MKKLLTYFFILLLIASFIAYKARGAIVKSVLERSVRSLTNLSLSLEDVDIDLAQHNLSLKNLLLYNPPNFEKAVMIKMPHVYIDYNLSAAMQGKVDFNILKLDIEELLIIRNEKGHLNFMRIKGLQTPSGSKKTTGSFKIDKLYFSLGKVVYKDYFRKRSPMINVYNLNIKNQLFENVDNPKALVSSIMRKALMQTNISNLLNYNINILNENLTNVIDRGGVMIKEFQVRATESIKDGTGNLKQTIKNIFTQENE